VADLAKDKQYLNLDIVLSMAPEMLPGYTGYVGDTDDLECTPQCTNIVGNLGSYTHSVYDMRHTVQKKKKKSHLFQ
jgi:hypothetical protein